MLMRKIFILGIVFFLARTAFADASLKPFDFPRQSDPRGTGTERPACEFTDLSLPEAFLVYAAGGYSGRKLDFQIDQSGHQATQFDLAVNSPDKPVVLVLGAYEPTVWNIGWSEGTRILGVLASGYHRQVVAGVDKKMPVLISSHENKGPCGYFYVDIKSPALERLNVISRNLFDKSVDMVYPVGKDGRIVIGEPLSQETKLVTSGEVPPEFYYDQSAPKAGKAGLDDAVAKGILRPATEEDEAAWAAEMDKMKPERDIPPVAGIGRPGTPKPNFRGRGYVILRPFTFPAGLYGGNSVVFVVAKGIPRPEGNPGHSPVYDFNTMQCAGPVCGR